MRAIKSISIPESCNQPWELMSVVAGGRHCDNCCKTVIDFTGMTDIEIINYFTAKNNVCGRFSDPQLTSVNLLLNHRDVKPLANRKKWIMTAALLASTVFHKATGQTINTSPKVEQIPSDRCNDDVTNEKFTVIKGYGREVRGRIVDETGMPLAGATLRLVGTDMALPTDTNGRFRFRSPKEAKQFTVSYVGFETATIEIDSLHNGVWDLKMVPQVVSMDNAVVITGYNTQRGRVVSGGAVTVVKETFTKRRSWLWRIYYKYIRTPVHNIFYKH